MAFGALIALLLGQAPPAPATAPAEHAHEPGRDQFHNPKDTDAYIARQEEPARAAWQKPDEVLKALSVHAGETVCDIGAGPGYFSLRLSRLVGPQGRVFAVDVDPHILAALRDRVENARAANVTPILGLAADPLLPPGACDLILIVDTYHHFPDRPAYLRRLLPLLRPGGRLANIDFQKRATPVGPPLEHRVSREEFLRDATGAGFVLVAEPKFLENQYFLVLGPRPRPR